MVYASTVITQFIVIAMSIVGRALYLQGLLRDNSTVSSEDLSAANRIFICLAPRFVQHGVVLLSESVRNAVKAVFNRVSLVEPTSRLLFSSLLSQVRHEIESSCGKNIFDDCLFGKLDEVLGTDVSPTRRRLFVALTTETRRHMKDEHLRVMLRDEIKFNLDGLLEFLFPVKEEANQPLVSLIPKISTVYHSFYSDSHLGPSLRQLSAAVFVDAESDVQGILVRSY